ncbi:MAG: urea transporter [Paludibacter sp.]|nr:urea transporter [Paludibacter sp.]MDD4199057.1 urea transporter [Paludibacter sp.]
MSHTFKNIKETILPAVLNSYSVIFFLNNRSMAIAVMLATFLNFYAGLSGLVAVIIAVLLANSLGFDKVQLRNGVLSFNALITGIGLGTYFDPGIVFFTLLALSSVLTLIISVALGGRLFKYGLPYLSIPFVLTFWFILLPSSLYENLGLTQRNIFWINEMYSVGGNSLLSIFQYIESWELNKLLEIYLRSLSSIFFQDNLITGVILAVVLLLSSRIFFSLSILGFVSAYIFAQFSGSEAASITYYNIGANFIMVAIAIGGFFVIPSRYSYLWTILLVPLTSIVLVFFTKLFNYIQLPVFSLPYSLVTIAFVHFLQQRANQKKLILTPIQHYSPETNLYAYLNNKERLSRFLYYPVQLPFWGEWTVTQGHDGTFTHKDEWGKAFDFMILDDEGKSYQSGGLSCEDYYCFGKPVTAPADGFVVETINHIEDNPVGEVNTTHNWGNSIVIQHVPGIYAQLSHLKKDSLKVKKGDYVKSGDVLAQCGNSGRSPYPHLHFQIQNNPAVGAETSDYPISYYLNIKQKNLEQFARPAEGDVVSNLRQHPLLFNAFNFLPDTSIKFCSRDESGNEITEHWDAYTDAFNYKYLYSRETDAVAYYTCDNMMFYFTAFYGSRKSLLYYFFLSAYKILLSDTPVPVKDNIPIHLLKKKKLISSLNDFTAPFFNFLKAGYTTRVEQINHFPDTPEIQISTETILTVLGKQSPNTESRITINQYGIDSFKYISGKKVVHAKKIK